MALTGASVTTDSQKIRKKNYSSDIEVSVKYSRWLLRTLGIWSMISKNPSTMEKIVSKFIIVICAFSLAWILIPLALHTALIEKNLVLRLVRLGPIATGTLNIVKYMLIARQCNAIKWCLEHMENDWMTIDREKERAIMTINAKFGRSLTIIACIFMYTGHIFYHAMMPLIKGTKLNERNETVRPLVYTGFDIFVDAQKSPNYEIIFWVTIAAASVKYTVAITACNLAAVFVTHACGQLQIVMSRLDTLFDEIGGELCDEEIRERISSVIQCHVRSLRLSTRIDDILRQICLIEVISATLIICILEYSCMMEWNNRNSVGVVTYMILVLSYGFNMFIFCYIGELLQERCYEIGTTTYLIDWYNLPGKTGLALVMILAMSNYPRKITAGGMMDISIASFGMIIKTSMVYLNMISQFSG